MQIAPKENLVEKDFFFYFISGLYVWNSNGLKCSMLFGQFSKLKLQDPSSKKEKINRARSSTSSAHIFINRSGDIFIHNI